MSLPLSYLDITGSGSESEGENNKIQAVRIGCDGEVRELDVPRFQPIMISAYDPAFRQDNSVSNLSRFIGIPIAARKETLDFSWAIDLHNAEATGLFRNCDIGALLDEDADEEDESRVRFGATPEEWTVDVGPVVIARVDGKPLHPLHAAAISAFCARYLQAPFTQCMESEQTWQRMLHPSRDSVFEQRRAVLAEAAPSKFAQFFEQYKRKRVRGRPDLLAEWSDLDSVRRLQRWSVSVDEAEPKPEWKDVLSPFDV